MSDQKKKKQVDENITKKNRIPDNSIIDIAEHLNVTEIIGTTTGSVVPIEDYEKYIGKYSGMKNTVMNKDLDENN